MIKNLMNHEPVATPATQLARLRSSPLRRVLCAVQFSPILRIAEHTGAGISGFQDSIRSIYPSVDLDYAHEVELTTDETGMVSDSKLLKQPVWRFSSQDKRWRASLTTQSLALEIDSDYDGRVSLVERFMYLVSALNNSFDPVAFKRLGFRFFNMFDGERLDRLGEYIRQDLLNFSNGVLDFSLHSYMCRSGFATNGNQVIVQHGLAPQGTQTDMQSKPSESHAWILDIDSSRPIDTAVRDVELRKTATEFTDTVCRFFAWSVTKQFVEEHRSDGDA